MNEEIAVIGRMLTECLSRSLDSYLMIRYSRRQEGKRPPYRWHVSTKIVRGRRLVTSSGETIEEALGRMVRRLIVLRGSGAGEIVMQRGSLSGRGLLTTTLQVEVASVTPSASLVAARVPSE